MKIIESLKNLKYIKNPCKKCLVNSMCGAGKRCDKFLKHCDLCSYIEFEGIILGSLIVFIIILLIWYIKI